MSDIYLNTTPTIAGIKSIFWFIPVRDVASQAGATVTLTAGKQWRTAKGTKFKGSITTRQLGHKAFSISLTTKLAHLSPALDAVLKQYTGAEGFLVIYDDLNGYRWLIGSKSQPLRLRHNYGSGSTPGESVGVSLSFSGNVTGQQAKIEYTDAIDAGTVVPV